MKGLQRLPRVEGCSVPGGLVFGARRRVPWTMDLPNSKGTYVLILRLERPVEMTIGRLGRFCREVEARWPGVLVVRRVPRAPAPPTA